MRLAGVVLVVAGLGLSAWSAQRTWLGYRPIMQAGTFDEVRAAGTYLTAAHIPPGRRLVFVLDDRHQDAWSRIWIAAHTVRAALPASRVPRISFYVGTVASYLAGRPTTIPASPPGPGGIEPSQYSAMSATYFASVRRTYAEHPVVFVLAPVYPGFGAWVASDPARAIDPGAAVVVGPPPPGGPSPSVLVTAAALPGPVGLAAMAVGVLALAWIAGFGWGSMLLRPWLRPFEMVAVAPAVGTAMIVVVGVVLARFGVRPGGAGALAIVGVTVAGGWVPWLLRRSPPPRREGGSEPPRASRPNRLSNPKGAR
jgi:hypothetical protein